MMNCFKPAWLLLLAAGVAAAQTPSVDNVVNAASGIPQGLPDSGIAQGSIFLVTGNHLGPSTIAIADSPFTDTTVGGTSIAVTVGSTTVNALMYYSSATQVSALLPSATPTGAGTLTLTFNGTASTAYAISVAANAFGIFTLSQNGVGVAVVTQPDYSVVSSIPGTGNLGVSGCASVGVCPYTYSGAANPGDSLTIWGTGLGPVAADDLAHLGMDMSSLPVSIWIGGVKTTATYRGRSGCCIGEDQVQFTVPANAPTGCAVPLAVQIGDTTISNYASLAVASGTRSCTPSSPLLTSPDVIQSLTTGSGVVNYATLDMGRTIGAATSSGVTYEDYGLGSFAQINISPTNQPTVISSLDTAPMGLCTTSNTVSSGSPALFSVNTGVDAGKITVNGPQGAVAMTERQSTISPTQYASVFSAQGLYFTGGAYTVTGGGGKDIGSFTNAFTVTATPIWPSSDQYRLYNNSNGVNRSASMTVNWTGGSSNYYVLIRGSAATDATAAVAASFTCVVPSTSNPNSANGTYSFTVPANILLTLPASLYGEIDFEPIMPPMPITADNLALGALTFHYQTSFFLTFN